MGIMLTADITDKIRQLFADKPVITLFTNQLGSFTAGRYAFNNEPIADHPMADEDGDIVTDDFTPIAALYRLAVKVIDREILQDNPLVPAAERGYKPSDSEADN